MAYTKYSLTPADNNAAPPNGAPEGMLPSAVNDTMRDMMSQIRDVGDGIRDGTYTMTAPKITGGSITGVTYSNIVITGGSITGAALSGNTFTNPVISGGSINNTPIGATTATTATFTTATVNRVEDSQGGVLAPISSVMRNRIINGAMVIDQRNAGASVTVSANDTAVYIADRWYIAKNSSATISSQRSTVAPTGFSNSLLVNVSSGSAVGSTNYLVCGQAIEGFNFADMAWGTASAQSISISFWVRSSLTGTFAVTLANSANNRCFGANYTISSANTWEYKTITIAGDTTGTWVGATNGVGLTMYFSLGAGSSYQGSAGSWQAISNLLNTSTAQNTFLTSANTFYITGVQLEKGTQATSFEYRQYGTELALCQRYCNRLDYANGASVNTGYVDSATSARGGLIFPTMRTSASATASSATHFKLDNGAGAYVGTGISFDGLTPTSARMILNSSGMTSGQGGIFLSVNAGGFILLTAEL